jgi:hypothetical protein
LGLSRSGTLFLIGLLVLIALSLHPVASVETAVDWAFAPSRVLAELARPFAWLSHGGVAAAEADASGAFEVECERSRAVLFAAQAAAMPVDPALRSGRAAVACHVIGRYPKNQDRLRLRFAVDAGVAMGSPVVSGDAFVGRVIELDPVRPGECIAELVTAKDFRVSAIVEGTTSPARFVVGGVLGKAKKDEHDLHLAVQFPSDRGVVSGVVRVLEEAGSREARLADGFLLGELGWVDVRGTKLFGIRAPLDYAFGLAHLAILVPPERGTAGPVLPIDPFEATSWLDTRVILAGDPSALRDTRRLALTSSSGIGPGAALAIGARFAGRLERVGPLDSDARLLADPGLAFSALARIEGQSSPVALGRLVSLGSTDGGAVLFECSAVVPLARTGGVPVKVELWTAAAEPDLPPGLLVGEALLDSASRPFTLRVVPAVDARQMQSLRAWRGRVLESGDDS